MISRLDSYLWHVDNVGTDPTAEHQLKLADAIQDIRDRLEALERAVAALQGAD